MFGTVALFTPKVGQEQAIVEALDKWWEERRPKVRGAIASTIHKNITNPSELIMSVVFDSEESYRANAADPEQHQWYLGLRELLENDPRWIDGEVLACKHA